MVEIPDGPMCVLKDPGAVLDGAVYYVADAESRVAAQQSTGHGVWPWRPSITDGIPETSKHPLYRGLDIAVWRPAGDRS
jgi:hypothetical protein